MQTLDVLKKRRSIREFQKKPIPRKTLETLVDAARFAPTAMNLQPWEFVVVVDKDMLRKIAQISDHGKFIAEAAACVLVFSKDVKYYLEDCCAATQTLMLAAASQGIGSCWVAGDKKPYVASLGALVNAPQDCRLVSMIALGFPLTRKSFRVGVKRDLRQLLHWEKF